MLLGLIQILLWVGESELKWQQPRKPVIERQEAIQQQKGILSEFLSAGAWQCRISAGREPVVASVPFFYDRLTGCQADSPLQNERRVGERSKRSGRAAGDAPKKFHEQAVFLGRPHFDPVSILF